MPGDDTDTPRRREGPRRKRRPRRHPSKPRRDGAAPRTAGPRHDRLYGVHAVAAALANPVRRCHRLVVTAEGAAALEAALAGRALAPGPRALVEGPEERSRHEIDRLAPPGAVHQGIVLDASPLPAVDLTAAARQALQAGAGAARLVVLDQVSDPHNVGAILRSAAAFGVSTLVVQERHTPHATGTLAKAASGALEAVALVRVTNVARALVILQDIGYWCLGLDARAPHAIADVAATTPAALVLGSEGGGLRRLTRERCDLTAAIPMPGAMPSLNVSNAAAIALYALSQAPAAAPPTR